MSFKFLDKLPSPDELRGLVPLPAKCREQKIRRDREIFRLRRRP